MSFQLSAKVSLRNERVLDSDADRQMRTAAEILRRLNDQPGLVLADEVGMGKTYVALAVAVSVLESTRRRRPVVVMVPAAVAEKWPTEWEVFSERCLSKGHGFRASQPIRRGSDFLKQLDDPAPRRNHLIFLTHGALTNTLNDPFIHLALIRRAIARRAQFNRQRRALARFAGVLLNERRFDEHIASSLLEAPTAKWLGIWNKYYPDKPLDDDPVPLALERSLKEIDLTPLRSALATIPLQRSTGFEARARLARLRLNEALNQVWTASLAALNERLPLLILDEAHHVKNPTRLSRLFANEQAEKDAEALQGPLGNMFERMLFLTATPFQLGHHELLGVLSRFNGVRWPSNAARIQFGEQIQDLGTALNRSKEMALRFERAWARIDLTQAESMHGLTSFELGEEHPETVRIALELGAQAQSEIESGETLLRPWVIRHTRPDRSERRDYLPGRSILQDVNSDLGLPVEGSATLPFLLASRAQAVASLQSHDGQSPTRSYFAYGLASSFEAYADTRRNRAAALDQVGNGEPEPALESPQLQWYLDRISRGLPADTADGWAAHPKVAAVVQRVRELWCKGEKVLVFCFYVETGRSLRSHISRALRSEIISRAAQSLSLDPSAPDEVLAAIDRLAIRLLRADSSGYQVFRKRVRSLASNLDDKGQDEVAEVVIRFMRTPSFLVRSVDISPNMAASDLLEGLDRPDGSGTTLAQRLQAFSKHFGRSVDVERDELLGALNNIQTGGIASTSDDFDPSERSHRREVLLPNVRLANGGAKRETRRRLMLAFNTPFFPEVLVASSVMSEGVDLQRDCRYVIHHDLDWNPSTLEQRNGRVDRIGSKAEISGLPVTIYEPFLGGTYDEKMYRVVKDRERWFGVVMGNAPNDDERETESVATRVQLPLKLAENLTMNLSLEAEASW